MTFTVAIIGRPNVGKSTLFNRLVGKRLALVDETAGVTRDRREGEARLGALSFRVIDTAGLEEADAETLSGRMRAQTERAIAEADLSLFLIDARAGVVPADRTFADLLRRAGRPVVLVANKVEGSAGEAGYFDAYSLGLGEPVPISAEHGQGLADLHDAIVAAIGAERAFAGADEALPTAGAEVGGGPLRIAVVGRPNAGKSTLINRLLGEERLLTGPEAGITRDAIAVDLERGGRALRLFDTAGLRRKARVQEKLEKLSVADALRAVQFAEVVIVVIDTLQPFDKQDLQIADLVIREGRAPVIALNKWDLVDDRQETLARLAEEAGRLLPQVKRLRLVPVSGLTGEGLDRLVEAVFAVHADWNRRIPTARLNRWLEEAVARHPPPAVAGRRVRIKYLTQVKARPPTFIAACSRPEALPDSYRRYLVNALAEEFDLGAVPLRLNLRRGENPYAGRARKRR
ncbi:MAG: GTPase Der [Alphaproteobacteria bacterium]|nr:MAG: GTPase Der [Alphaproteobacteria bacterium]